MLPPTAPKPNPNPANLVINSVWSVLVGNPSHHAGVALLADQGQGALVGPEGGVLVGLGAVVVGGPVAEAAHAGGDQLAVAGPADTSVDFYALVNL